MSGTAHHGGDWLPVFLLAAFLVLTLGSHAALPATGGGHGGGFYGGGHGGGVFREAESSGVAASVRDKSRTSITMTMTAGHSSSRTTTTPSMGTTRTTDTTRTIPATPTTRTATGFHLITPLNTATGTARRTAAMELLQSELAPMARTLDPCSRSGPPRSSVSRERRRLLPEAARLARATPVPRHRGGEHQRSDAEGNGCGRSSAG